MKSLIDFYKALYSKVQMDKTTIQTLVNGQSKVLEMLSNGSSLAEVLDSINLLIEKVSSEGICSVLLVEDNHLILGSAPNLPKDYYENIEELPIGPSAASCGTAAYLKKQVIVSNIAVDPLWMDYKEKALENGLKSCWSNPVCDTQQNVLAVFAMYFRNNRTPSDWDIQLMEHAVKLIQSVIQHFRSEEEISFLRFYDELTGLPNRKLFLEKLNIAINLYTKKHGKMLAVFYFDLDQFKLINDTLGHKIGDILLKGVAERLKSCIRDNDVASRQGSDEFSLLVNNVSKHEVTVIAERINDILAKSFEIEDHEVFVTPSIGISLYPLDGDSADELVRKADVAMNQVKKVGSNNYQFYEALWDKKTNERLMIENELRKAIDKNEFKLHYQPIIDIATNKINSVEALIRWNHPSLGMIPPDKFIPIAEETGLIVTIGEWVVNEACHQLKQWQDSGLPLSTISVNISIRQFYQPNLVPMIAQILRDTGINPICLTIEITESMTMDVEKATTILRDLKNLGVNISIDDFGTGYSSLSYLKKFPIDYLKIDRSFIRDIDKCKDDENIATAILLMGKTLGLNIIAEGVETSEQLGILRNHNCNEAQGYLFSKPISNDELKTFVTNLTN
ncbi:GGDEF domain-containing protein [Neobacillus niacini]|uniref:bifunctional diguanylate cyclase/phosphodiesterase n=1 Tax=Neobacillus niacini TaxID=86668 RepID=UPI0030025DAA